MYTEMHSNRCVQIALSFVVAVLWALAPNTSRASVIDLGPAGDYAILGLNGATINLSSGPLRVNGNVGIGAGGHFNFSGGGQVSGRLDADPTAQISNGSAQGVAGGVQTVNFSAIQAAALSETVAAAALTPTQMFGSITNPITINSTGAVNVIDVSSIHLSGGNFTLNGGPNDLFVVNDTGDFELSGNTNMLLSGGLTTNHVLFNFVGSGPQVQTSGQSFTVGTFLGVDRVFNINGGTHGGEFIGGLSLSFQSNPIVNQVRAVPLPTSLPMTAALVGLLGVGYLRRRQVARQA